MSELRFEAIGAAGPRRYFTGLAKSTMAHAYLFSGPSGVGKKSFARRLAQSLLCEAPKAGVLGYDGTCASCRLFNASTDTRHPDFLEHVGALKIGDSDGAVGFYEQEDLTARDLVRQLSMQSYSGGLRVLLLGDVEFSTHHAANALLKFFEEPPRDVVLLLTSSAPGRLIPTIRSRLVDIRFPALSAQELAQVLQLHGKSAEEIRLGVSLGQGSATRALDALAGGEDALRATTAQWFFSVVAGETPAEPWATRETLDDGLQTIKSLVRDWLVIASIGDDAALMSADYAGRLARLPAPPAEVAVALLAKIDEAQRLSRTNVSPAMVSEIVRMALTARV
ncbi:MAG: DNA polymerase III subunit [Vulcanimicrobiaceae bacterium]